MKERAENIDAEKKDGGRRLIIGVIIIGAFISSLNQTVMTASMPRIMTEFGIGAGVGQWLTTGYLLFMGVMIPCTGYLMEHYSAKRLYLVSVSMFFIGCAAAAFSPNIHMLLFARVIQALGAGILLPLPQVVAFRLYEPDKRGMIMGIVGLTTGFAPAFGPTFAGWMVDGFGWRAIFYVMCALALLGILLALAKLPDEQMHSDGKLDILSVVLSTIGFCGLLTGVTNQGNYGFASVLTLAPLAAGVVCVALFAARQLKIQRPLLELRVFQSRNFTFGTVLLVFAYGSMLSVSTLLPVYVQNLRGYSATASGLVMLPGAMFLALLNPLTGKILDQKGPYLLSLAGLACLGGATLGLAFVGESTPLIAITLIYAVRMLGIVALLQPLQTWAVNSVEERHVAHGTALMNTVRQVGGAIVSALLVTVMSTAAKTGGDLKGIQSSFLATSVMVAVCLAVAAFFMRSPKSASAAEGAALAAERARDAARKAGGAAGQQDAAARPLGGAAGPSGAAARQQGGAAGKRGAAARKQGAAAGPLGGAAGPSGDAAGPSGAAARQQGGAAGRSRGPSVSFPGSSAPSPSRTVITIAREYGSGGRIIGEKVAGALGVPFYDKEIIAMESKESGLSKSYAEALDEGFPAGSAALDWAAKSYGAFEAGLFAAGNITAVDQMHQAQNEVIKKIAREGSCVIIGRCANYILKDDPGRFSVFIRSDADSRRRRVATEYGVGAEKAGAEMKRKDGERAFHHKRYTGQSWGAPENYHLILDSGAMGVEKCVKLIVEAAAPMV